MTDFKGYAIIRNSQIGGRERIEGIAGLVKRQDRALPHTDVQRWLVVFMSEPGVEYNRAVMPSDIFPTQRDAEDVLAVESSVVRS